MDKSVSARQIPTDSTLRPASAACDGRMRPTDGRTLHSCVDPDPQTWNWVTGSAGQWVIWVVFHVPVIVSSFWPGETRVLPVFEKIPKMQNAHLKCWHDKSHCQVSVVGLKSLDVSPCNELLLLPMIIKKILWPENTSSNKSRHLDWIYYRTGSPGQLGLRVAGFPGHWVAKCDAVSMERLSLLTGHFAWRLVRLTSSHRALDIAPARLPLNTPIQKYSYIERAVLSIQSVASFAVPLRIGGWVCLYLVWLFDLVVFI